jgi:hypothetical protein
MSKQLTFFIDVDNTLLNNDLIKQQIKLALVHVLGHTEADHFWRHHDEFRAYQKLVDFPGVTRAYCAEQHGATCERTVGSIFTNINFVEALFPNALQVITYLKILGEVYIFSEGDAVYQNMKIQKSGIAAVAMSVLLYKHKLDHLDEAFAFAKNGQPVVIDDRDDKLMEIKKRIPRALTIVVCQGHYARANCAMNHTADKVVDSVGELMQWKLEDF